MKKKVIILIAMVVFAFVANAQQSKASVPGDYGNTVLVSVSEDRKTSTDITFYNNSTKSIKVTVRVYNETKGSIGEGTFDVPAAQEQGYHSEITKTLSKNPICGHSDITAGCEVKRIEITKVTVKK